MTRPPAQLKPGDGPGEGSTGDGEDQDESRQGPSGRDSSGTGPIGPEGPSDATTRPSGARIGWSTRGRSGDLGTPRRGSRRNAPTLRRGGWIDPTRGNETLGSFYEPRWKRQAAETGRPSERTLIAYDELWRLYIAPKLQDQSLEHHHSRRCRARRPRRSPSGAPGGLTTHSRSSGGCCRRRWMRRSSQGTQQRESPRRRSSRSDRGSSRWKRSTRWSRPFQTATERSCSWRRTRIAQVERARGAAPRSTEPFTRPRSRRGEDRRVGPPHPGRT